MSNLTRTWVFYSYASVPTEGSLGLSSINFSFATYEALWVWINTKPCFGTVGRSSVDAFPCLAEWSYYTGWEVLGDFTRSAPLKGLYVV